MQQLAESGDYEGLNAIVGVLLRDGECDTLAIDVIKRDAEFKNRITNVCHETWQRKHGLHLR
jgi:hypothetical protein